MNLLVLLNLVESVGLGKRKDHFLSGLFHLLMCCITFGKIIYPNLTDEETKARRVVEDSSYEVILRTSNNKCRTVSTGLALSENSLHENNRLP